MWIARNSASSIRGEEKEKEKTEKAETKRQHRRLYLEIHNEESGGGGPRHSVARRGRVHKVA